MTITMEYHIQSRWSEPPHTVLRRNVQSATDQPMVDADTYTAPPSYLQHITVKYLSELEASLLSHSIPG